MAALGLPSTPHLCGKGVIVLGLCTQGSQMVLSAESCLSLVFVRTGAAELSFVNDNLVIAH